MTRTAARIAARRRIHYINQTCRGGGNGVSKESNSWGETDGRGRAAQGVLAAWLNKLPETQGVSLGPWDRVRIDQYPRRRRRPGRVAAPRRPLDPDPVAR